MNEIILEKDYLHEVINDTGKGSVRHFEMEGIKDGGSATLTVIQPPDGDITKFKVIIPGTTESANGYEQQIKAALAEGYAVAVVNSNWLDEDDAVNYGDSMDALGSAVVGAVNTLTDYYGAEHVDILAHSMGWAALQNAVLANDEEGNPAIDMRVVRNIVVVSGADQIDKTPLNEPLEELLVDIKARLRDGYVAKPDTMELGDPEYFARELKNIAPDSRYHINRANRMADGYDLDRRGQGVKHQYMKNFTEHRREFEEPAAQEEFTKRISGITGEIITFTPDEDAVLGKGNLKEQDRNPWAKSIDSEKITRFVIDGRHHGLHHADPQGNPVSAFINNIFIDGRNPEEPLPADMHLAGLSARFNNTPAAPTPAAATPEAPRYSP